MAKYQLRQDEKDRRRVQIVRKRLEMHWLALAVCLLVAFLLWLYVANGGFRQGLPDPPVAETDSTDSATDRTVTAMLLSARE